MMRESKKILDAITSSIQLGNLYLSEPRKISTDLSVPYKKIFTLALQNRSFVQTQSGSVPIAINIKNLFTPFLDITPRESYTDPVGIIVQSFLNGRDYGDIFNVNRVISEGVSVMYAHVSSMKMSFSNQNINSINMEFSVNHYALRKFRKAIDPSRFIYPSYFSRDIVIVQYEFVLDGISGLSFSMDPNSDIVFDFYVKNSASGSLPLFLEKGKYVQKTAI